VIPYTSHIKTQSIQPLPWSESATGNASILVTTGTTQIFTPLIWEEKYQICIEDQIKRKTLHDAQDIKVY
jgi:hypothetical protein